MKFNFKYQIYDSLLNLPNAGEHGIASLLVLLLLLLILSPPCAEAQSGTGGSNNDPINYARFSPSMAIVIVVLVAALFFMGFFSIYIRHCNDSIGAGGTARSLGGAAGRSRRAARGLEPAVIETFPTLIYSVVKGLKIGKGALECAVCLNEFEDDETLRLIPKCDHVFHPECIDAWLASHTTCPVCRANLVPEPGESVPQLAELDIEAQNNVVEPEPEPEPERQDRNGDTNGEDVAPEPHAMKINQTLHRNRTRGSRSGRTREFPRSHSTGHSLIQPGENTERFTLRLPVEVRKQIMNRKLNRATSMVVLPREGSSRRGYRTGGEGSRTGGEGSSRGKNIRRLERLGGKSERWGFSMTLPFFSRTSSLRSPKVAAASNDGEGTSAPPAEPGANKGGSTRPPV